MSASADILDARNLPVLARFSHSNVLLGFDYDGTLAPIVDAPERARMRARTRQLLARVSRRYACVVISGRALHDIARRVSRIPLWHVFGNHGFEPAPPEQHLTDLTAEWVRELRGRLPGERGVRVEDKTHTVTIHYRAARDRKAALSAIDEAVRSLRGVRVIDGADAVNLLPRDGPDKGFALRRAMARFGCESAIYVGDDGTDEDAFTALGDERVLGIRVGRNGGSRARFHIASQAEIDVLLQELASLRPSHREDFHPSSRVRRP